MTRRRLRSVSACGLLLAFASCSSGSTHETGPATTTPVKVVTSAPTPMANTVRKVADPSRCPQGFPATPGNSGVPRIDLVLVPIAAVRFEVCTYGGPTATRTRQGTVAFDGQAATTIENAVNSLTGIDPISGPRCEPGAAAAVLLVVSDGIHVEQLLASRVGCRGVSNGLLSAAATPAWTAVFEPAVALADLCTRRYGPSARCIASSS